MFISVVQVYCAYLNYIYEVKVNDKGSRSIDFTPTQGLCGRRNQAMLGHVAYSTSF